MGGLSRRRRTFEVIVSHINDGKAGQSGLALSLPLQEGKELLWFQVRGPGSVHGDVGGSG